MHTTNEWKLLTVGSSYNERDSSLLICVLTLPCSFIIITISVTKTICVCVCNHHDYCFKVNTIKMFKCYVINNWVV